MVALEVTLNGKRVCVAGAEDLAVLSTIISASGKLGKKTVPPRPGDDTFDIYYSVGGLTSRPDPAKDVHVRWESVTPLKVGDVIQVRILETVKVDRARSRKRAEPKRPKGASHEPPPAVPSRVEPVSQTLNSLPAPSSGGGR